MNNQFIGNFSSSLNLYYYCNVISIVYFIRVTAAKENNNITIL